jgi:glycosyltransferase involved in cell wall biosynthesis
VYVVRSWPRWSQGFVLDEVLNLEELGLDLVLCALTDPHEELVQPATARVRAPVRYFDQRSVRQAVADHVAVARRTPWRYARAARLAVRRPAWDRGYRVANRWQCFGYAVAVARVVRRARDGASEAPVRVHLHAHFAHDPAAVTHLTHVITGVPWTFTAHARDLYQVLPEVLAERVASAAAVVTCCGANVEYLHATLPPALTDRVRLVHHGVDSGRFRPAARPDPVARADPVTRRDPVIVSAGRLVEKKGFGDLLAACRLLVDRGHRFTCVLYGEGPLEAELASTIHRLGLEGSVMLGGAVPRERLLAELQLADVFVLTPHVTDDGDRDGIPNVVLEAMACGLPVVASAIAGIPEVIDDGATGVLVPAHDIDAIATALGRLLRDRDTAGLIGAAARERVVAHFDSHRAAETLLSLFTDMAGAGPTSPGAATGPFDRRAVVQVDG